MYCVRGGCFVKTIGLSPLCSFGVRVFTFFCSAQVKTEMQGIRNEWSTQRALTVSVCAVLASMCLTQALTRCVAFPVPQFSLRLSSQARKETAWSCLCCRSAKIGSLKTLRLVFRFAVVRHSLPSSAGNKVRKGMHDTRCINPLGLVITRRRVALMSRVVLVFVFALALTWCVVSKVGKPKDELTSWLSHAMMGYCGVD